MAGPQDDPKPKRNAPRRKGLPSADSVVSETTFTSPKGRVYRILRTNQTDPYDEPAGQSGDKATGASGGNPKDKPARHKGKRRRKS
jgi:hypothetical protein